MKKMKIKCTYRIGLCNKVMYTDIDDNWTVSEIREFVNDLILSDLGITQTSWEVVENENI